MICTMELLLTLAKHDIAMASSQYCNHSALFEGEKCNDVIQGHILGLSPQNPGKGPLSEKSA